MSKVHPSGVDRARGYSGDVGEIVSAPYVEPVVQIARAQLAPAEEAASLRPFNATVPSPIAPLTRFLGLERTVASPAWGENAVPRFRNLQKLLLDHALSRPEDERGPPLAAIQTVEKAVQLRLRYQQMHMSEVEMALGSENGMEP
ncbi:MAG TPA: hypothetical protein VEC35_22515 [Noviherbaspirillum sp.]|nr:hypothetical protein [Noviherbaspirillum sp.]